MSDILDEVLNDDKDTRRFLLFRKILPIIVVAVVIGAIGIASYSWYSNKKAAHNQKIGDMFVQLMTDDYKNVAENITALEDLVKNVDNKQEELAQLKIASLLILSQKDKEAMEKLDEVIQQKGYSEITTAFARILWINMVLDKSKVPDELQAKTRDYLQYFAESEQPFFVTATLMKSLFYKKVGQNDMAAEYANKILSLEDISPILKEQARAILSGIKLNLSIKAS